MQSGGTRSNISSMDRIEKSYKEAISSFEASNQLTLDWFGESKRRIVDIASKIESNCKKLHGLQQQTDGSITEISGCKAGIEVHEDQITKLEAKLKELLDAIRMHGERAENLRAQQLVDGATLKEIKDRVDKLEEAAQTVTI